jgi:poly(A) polymerase Pap1
LSLFQDPLRHDFEWTWLFEPFPYAEKHQQFLRIALCAPTLAELRDWAGWVKSRLRFLILKVLLMQLFCCFFMLLLHKSYGSLLIFGILNKTYKLSQVCFGSAVGKVWHWV